MEENEIFVTRIRTEKGDLQIDYNALANKPTTDTSLTISGKAADAKVVGDQITTLISYVDNQIDDISIADLGVTATVEELNYLGGVVGNIQQQLDEKFRVCCLWKNTTPSEIFKAQDVAIEGICDEQQYPYIIIVSNSCSVVLPNKAGLGNLSYHRAGLSDADGANGMLRFVSRDVILSDGEISFYDCFLSELHVAVDTAENPTMKFYGSPANANIIPHTVLGICNIHYPVAET